MSQPQAYIAPPQQAQVVQQPVVQHQPAPAVVSVAQQPQTQPQIIHTSVMQQPQPQPQVCIFESKTLKVHATIPEQSYTERAASTSVEHGNKLACNPRPHVITQRVLAQQKSFSNCGMDCKNKIVHVLSMKIR